MNFASGKCVIRENAGPSGSLRTESAATAILQYLNIPMQGFNSSPVQLRLNPYCQAGLPSGACMKLYPLEEGSPCLIMRQALTLADDATTLVALAAYLSAQ
ncbi:hypothetical protein Hamer_G015590 [Homarus americanus]|uniref:Uncharacterized protein n=1 Tax=Homarus americanus TaxID=6706 RepID=A0A8J5J9V5_HOMAM|nr:hypothetical protein Hamer_G015590 [Homarus americanus]